MRTVVVSDLVGYRRPQPEIFRFALDSLGVHQFYRIQSLEELLSMTLIG